MNLKTPWRWDGGHLMDSEGDCILALGNYPFDYEDPEDQRKLDYLVACVNELTPPDADLYRTVTVIDLPILRCTDRALWETIIRNQFRDAAEMAVRQIMKANA